VGVSVLCVGVLLLCCLVGFVVVVVGLVVVCLCFLLWFCGVVVFWSWLGFRFVLVMFVF
jgi:hypothetical protein